MLSAAIFSQIYDRFLAHCRPAIPDRLGFLPAHESCFWLPADPATVLTDLAGKFSRDELVAAGVVAGDEAAAATLVPPLCTPGGMLLAHRDGERTLELLTEAGSLTGGLPLFGALRDRHVRAVLPTCRRMLLVAFSLADVAALRALGLPATLATGLDRLQPRDIGPFCDAFGFEREQRPPPFAPDGQPPAQSIPPAAAAKPAAGAGGSDAQPTVAAGDAGAVLTFVEWSPSALADAIPAAAADIKSFFAKLARNLNIDFIAAACWRPTPQELWRMIFAAECQDAESLREEVWRSLDDSATGASLDDPPPLPPIDDCASAYAFLQQVARSSDTSWTVSARYKQAVQLVERTITERASTPLLAAAMSTADPLEANLLLALRAISTPLHRAVAASAWQAPHKSGGTGGALAADQLAEIKQHLALAKQFEQLTEAILKCRLNQYDRRDVRVISPPNSQRWISSP